MTRESSSRGDEDAGVVTVKEEPERVLANLRAQRLLLCAPRCQTFQGKAE